MIQAKTRALMIGTVKLQRNANFCVIREVGFHSFIRIKRAELKDAFLRGEINYS